MKRRLIHAWAFLSVAWILYGAYYAVSYWLRWGDFISSENRVRVWITTAVEIVAAPVLGGIVLFGGIGIAHLFGRMKERASRHR